MSGTGRWTGTRPGGTRVLAGAALTALATSVAALFVAAREDVTTQAALQDYLDRAAGRLALAWVLTVLSGLAWLVFVVGLRGLLPDSGGRDLFTVAAVSGQAASWVGISVSTAAVPAAAHDLPLPVFNAFGEAGHLTAAAGTAALGLALVGAAGSGRQAVGRLDLPRWFWQLTSVVGVLLVPAAVVGPLALPVTWLWLLVVAALLLRGPSRQRVLPAQAVAGSGG